MLGGFFKKRPANDDVPEPARFAELPSTTRAPRKRLLVVDGDARHNWARVFEGAHVAVSGCDMPIEVIQAGWNEFMVTSYPDGCQVDFITTVQQGPRSGGRVRPSFRPDFVLVRNEVRGLGAAMDWRPSLWGLMHAGVPSVNSLLSIMAFCERPAVHGELRAIERRVGHQLFPVVPQTYFPGHRAMLIGPSFPAVVKVGHAHAGYGKMRVPDHRAFEDFRSLMAVGGGYCTAEPFVVAEYDVRVQKIGDHYRAFKRVGVSGNWKTNTGSSVVQQVPMTAAYRRWADEAARMFGGLDICTVDALRRRRRRASGAEGGAQLSASPGSQGPVDEIVAARAALEDERGDGAGSGYADDDTEEEEEDEVILEVNGTSSGLLPDCEDEDHQHIRELVLAKMAGLWG